MTNSLIPKPFDIRDAKRAREEAARLAERRDGAAWSGTGEVAKAVEAETVAREELAELTEAEQQAIREQVVKEALERAEAFIDVNRTLDALDVKYDGVITDAGQIGTKLAKAETDIAAAKTRLDTAATDITAAFGQIGNVETKATAATTAASAAQGKADTAKTAADKAATDALAAAGLAGSKGEIIYQVSAPTGARANPANLWIRSSDDRPHTYDATTSKWVARTDKAALDAAAAASAAATAAANAASAAAAAQAAAGTAQETADNALTMAGSKSRVYYSTSAPSGVAEKVGDMWRRTDESKNVIGRWRWAGSSWVSDNIRTEVIDNLDVGKLTAGTAVINTLVSQKIAAAAGEFIKLDVGQLVVTGSGSMPEAVITKLWSEVVNSQKITTEMLAVGSFDNLFDEPGFTNKGASWTNSAPHNVGAFGRNGAPALRMVGQTGIVSIYNKPLRRPIAPESAYRGKVWVRASASVPASAFRILAAVYTATGETSYPMASAPALVAGAWTLVSGVIKTTSTAATASFGLSLRENFPAGVTLDVDFASLTRMNGGELTVDGTVTAQALESELVLATKIVAGDPESTHAEMSPLGFKVFASPAGGGTPAEVVRLGVAATDDFFAVSRADGSLAATISQDGVIVGDELNATSELWYKGDKLQTLLDNMPRGIVAAAYRATSSTVNATFGNPIPYLRVEATLLPGRVYKVWTSGVQISMTGSTQATLGIKYQIDGIANMDSGTFTETVTTEVRTSPVLQELIAVSSERVVSFLLNAKVLNVGEVGFRADNSAPTRIVVEDAGPLTNQIGNGTHLNGAPVGPPPTPPAAVNTYRKQYGSIGSMNYQGNNAQYNYNTGQMYQGLSPAGMGNTKSISIHPSMVGDLSGATINYIRVYFNFNHWYYNAGGTARIGLHGHSGIPGSFSGSGIAATSYNWPRPGARWVDLPSSVFAGFKSGAYKGIYLEGDGTYGTYGIADRPTIEIGFTK